MLTAPPQVDLRAYPNLRLPLALLIRYLFFLSRRPVSRSNPHYLTRRLNGLRSLSNLLHGTEIRDLQQAVHLLDSLNPTNFHLLTDRLQYILVPLAHAIDELPSDVVVSHTPPPADFLRRARTILLLCGPGIGIGDEIILFTLPLGIKQQNPKASLTVLSAYSGLWDRVNGVDATVYYHSYAEMLQTLRGEEPLGEVDLVILADFDRPGLAPAICFEDKLPRYVELSLGTQSLFVVDNQRRWLHQAPRFAPYFANYYAGFEVLARWLDIPAANVDRFSSVLRSSYSLPADRLTIYVSPFTSKYDPSELYWSRLLSTLFLDPPLRPVRFVLDPGPNAATQRFAFEVARSARARVPANVELEVAEPEDAPMPGLQAALSWMERAHVIICADSFSAHATPLFGRVTCVVALPGVENWRVPHRLSYYFSADEPIDRIARGIYQIIHSCQNSEAENSCQPVVSEAERRLEATTLQLQHFFAQGAKVDDYTLLSRLYADFATAYQETLRRVKEWPPELDVLLNDCDYDRLVHVSNGDHSVPGYLQQEAVRHLHDRWQRWHNTNLRKYLGLLLDESRPLS